MTNTSDSQQTASGRRFGLPQISDAEWSVMKVVWKQAPVTAKQVVAALEQRTAWKPKTIHTLLGRLVQKGALSYEKRGREFWFSPLVAARHCAREASRSFLRRVFDGKAAPFLSFLIEDEELTAAEIDELRRILEEKKL